MKSEKANKQDMLSILKKDPGKVHKIFQDFEEAVFTVLGRIRQSPY